MSLFYWSCCRAYSANPAVECIYNLPTGILFPTHKNFNFTDNRVPPCEWLTSALTIPSSRAVGVFGWLAGETLGTVLDHLVESSKGLYKLSHLLRLWHGFHNLRKERRTVTNVPSHHFHLHREERRTVTNVPSHHFHLHCRLRNSVRLGGFHEVKRKRLTP